MVSNSDPGNFFSTVAGSVIANIGRAYKVCVISPDHCICGIVLNCFAN